MTARSRYPKRGPVTMPAKPPYDVLRAMCGDPLILAASDEQWAVFLYAVIYEALKKRGRK